VTRPAAINFRGKYLAGLNRRFARVAASALDAHQAAPRNWNEVLSWEEERVVQADWTVACGGKWYQLDRQHAALSLVKRKVIVRTLRDGREQIVYRGVKLKWRGLGQVWNRGNLGRMMATLLRLVSFGYSMRRASSPCR